MQFYILTYTYLLFSNEVRPTLLLSLSPSSHTSASVLFHLTFKLKKKEPREYKSEKKCTLDEDAAIETHIYTQHVKRKKMNVIFK